MSGLAEVLPIHGNARDRRWRDAIVATLAQRPRPAHTPDCARRGRTLSCSAGVVTFGLVSVRGCPWCDFIRAQVMGGAR